MDTCGAKKCQQPCSIVIRGIPLCATHEQRTWDDLRNGTPCKETILKIVPRTLRDEVQ
jgi:hypothetical protein